MALNYPHQQQTLVMVAATGYTVTMVNPAASLVVLARGECWVKTVGSTAKPAAVPTVAAIPSAGLTTAYVHIKAGEMFRFGQDVAAYPAHSAGAPAVDEINFLQVWCVGAGNLVINAK